MDAADLYGFGVPPGIADAVVPNPIFSLVPSATVDEGNNWINVSWGPLALTNPSVQGADGNYGGGPMLGNYALTSTSPAVDYIPGSVSLAAGAIPGTDFFGHPRPDSGTCVDVGAVEFSVAATGNCVPAVPTLTSIAPTSGSPGNSVPVTLTGTNLTGATAVNVSGSNVTCTITGTPTATSVTATCTIGRGAALGGRNVSVTTPGGTTNTVTFTVGTGPALTSIAPTSGTQGTAVPVTLTGTNLTGATAVNVSGTGVTSALLPGRRLPLRSVRPAQSRLAPPPGPETSALQHRSEPATR